MEVTKRPVQTSPAPNASSLATSVIRVLLYSPCFVHLLPALICSESVGVLSLGLLGSRVAHCTFIACRGRYTLRFSTLVAWRFRLSNCFQRVC